MDWLGENYGKWIPVVIGVILSACFHEAISRFAQHICDWAQRGIKCLYYKTKRSMRLITRFHFCYLLPRHHLAYVKLQREIREYRRLRQAQGTEVARLLEYALSKGRWEIGDAASDLGVSEDYIEVIIHEAGEKGLIELAKSVQYARIFGLKEANSQLYNITVKGKKYLKQINLLP